MGLAETFKAVADPQRRELLTLLRSGRLNAGELSRRIDVTPAALSYHLKILKNADIVMEYREKNFIYYELNTSVFDEILLWVRQFGGDENEREKDNGEQTSVDNYGDLVRDSGGGC